MQRNPRAIRSPGSVSAPGSRDRRAIAPLSRRRRGPSRCSRRPPRRPDRGRSCGRPARRRGYGASASVRPRPKPAPVAGSSGPTTPARRSAHGPSHGPRPRPRARRPPDPESGADGAGAGGLARQGDGSAPARRTGPLSAWTGILGRRARHPPAITKTVISMIRRAVPVCHQFPIAGRLMEAVPLEQDVGVHQHHRVISVASEARRAVVSSIQRRSASR